MIFCCCKIWLLFCFFFGHKSDYIAYNKVDWILGMLLIFSIFHYVVICWKNDLWFMFYGSVRSELINSLKLSEDLLLEFSSSYWLLVGFLGQPNGWEVGLAKATVILGKATLCSFTKSLWFSVIFQSQRSSEHAWVMPLHVVLVYRKKLLFVAFSIWNINLSLYFCLILFVVTTRCTIVEWDMSYAFDE